MTSYLLQLFQASQHVQLQIERHEKKRTIILFSHPTCGYKKFRPARLQHKRINTDETLQNAVRKLFRAKTSKHGNISSAVVTVPLAVVSLVALLAVLISPIRVGAIIALMGHAFKAYRFSTAPRFTG